MCVFAIIFYIDRLLPFYLAKKSNNRLVKKGARTENPNGSPSSSSVVRHVARILLSLLRIEPKELYMGTVRFSIEVLYVGLFAACQSAFRRGP